MGENINDMRRTSDMSAVYKIEAQNNLILSQISGLMDSQRGMDSKMGQVSESVARLEQNVGHMTSRQDRTEDDVKDIRKEINALDRKLVWYGGALAVLSGIGYLFASGFLGQLGRSIANSGMTP